MAAQRSRSKGISGSLLTRRRFRPRQEPGTSCWGPHEAFVYSRIASPKLAACLLPFILKESVFGRKLCHLTNHL
ncbi:hypothetical protein RRG08_021840 [Elysia crispata]|uniref:Uncharacterized protein n=1 Tax=Elysia crispata TaxID=231223 RepID=A0AAE0ZYC3_9GAST|nr:hypothetical protein RRG08_021840 [Elysia crispata]